MVSGHEVTNAEITKGHKPLVTCSSLDQASVFGVGDMAQDEGGMRGGSARRGETIQSYEYRTRQGYNSDGIRFQRRDGMGYVSRFAHRHIRFVPVLVAMGLLFVGSSLLAQTNVHHGPVAKTTAAAVDDTASKSFGSKSAPMTMEVFSDFECPSCRMLYEQTLRPMIGDYVASGKVYLVHRDFPLPMHKYSYEAARWADAAARIGHYGEVEGALFDNQAAWSADGNIQKYVEGSLSAADFRRVAKLMEGCELSSAGIKPAAFALQVHGCALDAAIDRDVALGKTIPIEATPTMRFTYKGRPYGPTQGFVSWQLLKQFCDQLMTQ